MKKFFTPLLLLMVFGFSFAFTSAATTYPITNLNELDRVLYISWTPVSEAGAQANIYLEGPTSCKFTPTGAIGICTADIRQVSVGGAAASSGRFEWHVDLSTPRLVLGKSLYVEINGQRINFTISKTGSIGTGGTVTTGSGTGIKTVDANRVPRFVVTLSPSVANAGDAVLISWNGSYERGVRASLTFERPTSCNKSLDSDVLLCTSDQRYVSIGNVNASDGIFKWQTDTSTRYISGNVNVTINGVTGVTALRLNPTSGVSRATSGTPFSVTCEKTTGSVSANFSASYIGGTFPYRSVWLDNGVEVSSLDNIRSSGQHKISILATDSAGATATADCGPVTIVGGITNSQSTLGSVCVNITSNLRRGTRGSAVVLLQDFLRGEGHFNEESSGYFGVITEQAVKAFQTANGIESTGFVGVLTRGKIKDISCS